MPSVWASLNCSRVSALAFGNELSAAFSAAVFAAVTPPCMFRKV